ncbi:MAG: UDP-2,3-diacylglucosamine diphosphatase LpxI [Pseudomonadota bacterium]
MRWSKIAIITGGGALPLKLAAACEARGDPFHMVRLVGYADNAAQSWPGVDLHLGEVGKLSRVLKEEACDAIVMAGIVTRPDFSKLKLDWKAAALLPRIVAASAKGDGAILSAIVDMFEADGIKVVGADEVAGDLTAATGQLGVHQPNGQHFEDIKKAASVIRALGPYDVGQGAICANGLVLAIEAAEGTDAMLSRCALLPSELRGKPNERSGVLVKMPKPGQELRVDLPTIGLETIRRASEAGLAGIAFAQGRALFVDAEEALAEADRNKMFVYGFSDVEINRQ